MVDQCLNEIYISPRYVLNGSHKVNWKIKIETNVAAYVAHTKEYIMVDEVLGDERFPDGVDYKGWKNIFLSLSPASIAFHCKKPLTLHLKPQKNSTK